MRSSFRPPGSHLTDYNQGYSEMLHCPDIEFFQTVNDSHFPGSLHVTTEMNRERFTMEDKTAILKDTVIVMCAMSHFHSI